MSQTSLAGVVLAVVLSTACEDLPRRPAADGGADVRADAAVGSPTGNGTGGQPGMQPGGQREDGAVAPDVPVTVDAPPSTPDAPSSPADRDIDMAADTMVDMAVVPPPPAEALWDQAHWDLSVWAP